MICFEILKIADMKYRFNHEFSINCGFPVTMRNVASAVQQTNKSLSQLPFSLYRSIDYKTTSAIVGALFCDSVAYFTDGVVNPIEKGHPDLIPIEGEKETEEVLRNYPVGLEVKATVGNIQKGANLRAGQRRISLLTGITWQAHHRETRELMGLVWDFAKVRDDTAYPTITGVFYSDQLENHDWGKISGTTGRNTKVTGMKVSGKKKMGAGWVAIPAVELYSEKLTRLLKFHIPATVT